MTLTLTKPQGTSVAADPAQTRQEWEKEAARLADDVQAWANEAARGWRVERDEKELSEEAVGGVYRVPMVTIHAPQGRLILEPVARAAFRAEGRVDLSAWPSLFRVMLLHKPTGRNGALEWVVRTESGLDWPQPWSRETFLTLADGLLKA